MSLKIKIIFFLVTVMVVTGLLLYTTRSRVEKKSNLDIQIQRAEGEVRAGSTKVDPFISLADLYLQKVRETADSRYYSEIDNLMAEAERIASDEPHIFFIQAQVANGRHDFVAGENLAKRAVALRPMSAKFYGPLFDAVLEQGGYGEAERILQKMVNTRPDFSSLTRVAYFRELHGDIDGAQKALGEALSGGAPYQENAAWGRVELGKLIFRRSPLEAKEYFNQALEIKPDYPPALEWLGRSEFVLGDTKKAREYFQRAYELLPINQYAILLGELAEAEGNHDQAQKMYFIARIAFENSYTNGVNSDMEYAYFLSESNLDPNLALEKAKAAYEKRQSIHGADVLAWAYFKVGDYKKAAQFIQSAMRLGAHDGQIAFHASKIYGALGNKQMAALYMSQAKSLNPYFSILHYRELTQ